MKMWVRVPSPSYRILFVVVTIAGDKKNEMGMHPHIAFVLGINNARKDDPRCRGGIYHSDLERTLIPKQFTVKRPNGEDYTRYSEVVLKRGGAPVSVDECFVGYPAEEPNDSYPKRVVGVRFDSVGDDDLAYLFMNYVQPFNRRMGHSGYKVIPTRPRRVTDSLEYSMEKAAVESGLMYEWENPIHSYGRAQEAQYIMGLAGWTVPIEQIKSMFCWWWW